MKKNNTFINVSIIAAIYVVLSLILAPISFGPIQFRLSELVCILAIEFPFAISGVTIGCFLANLFFGGLGIIDVIFGSLATLIACLLAYRFRKIKYKEYPLLSGLMIVLCNAIIVGIEFGFLYDNIKIIPISMLEIGISEFVIIMLIGMPLYPKLISLIKNKLSN